MKGAVGEVVPREMEVGVGLGGGRAEWRADRDIRNSSEEDEAGGGRDERKMGFGEVEGLRILGGVSEGYWVGG